MNCISRRLVSILFIALQITGTVYAATQRWETKSDESQSDSLPSANYGSTASNEKENSESKEGIWQNHYSTQSVLPVVSDDVCDTRKSKCFLYTKATYMPSHTLHSAHLGNNEGNVPF